MGSIDGLPLDLVCLAPFVVRLGLASGSALRLTARLRAGRSTAFPLRGLAVALTRFGRN
jgi:hypothetical protein